MMTLMINHYSPTIFAPFSATHLPAMRLMLKHMKKLLILATLTITGCTTTPPEKIVTPDGNEGYSIKCGAGPDNCYTIAGELCPDGYNVIDRSNNASTASTGDTYPMYSMGIECK